MQYLFSSKSNIKQFSWFNWWDRDILFIKQMNLGHSLLDLLQWPRVTNNRERFPMARTFLLMKEQPTCSLCGCLATDTKRFSCEHSAEFFNGVEWRRWKWQSFLRRLQFSLQNTNRPKKQFCFMKRTHLLIALVSLSSGLFIPPYAHEFSLRCN